MLTLRCLSHSCSVVVFVLQLTLFTVACLLGYMLLRDDIPVPSFLHGRIERELARIGLQASFDSAQFDPAGRIFVRGLRLHPSRFSDSIFEAERVFIQLDRIKLLAGKPELELLEAEHARVICPPTISPSGISEILLHVTSARLRHSQGLWSLDGLAGKLGSVRLTARGSYFAETLEAGAKPPDIDSILTAYAKHAPQLVRAHEWLAHLVEPALDLAIEGRGRTVDAALVASAMQWRNPRFGDATRILAAIDASMEDGKIKLPLRADASVAGMSRANTGSAEDLQVSAEWTHLPTAKNPWPHRLELSTGTITHAKLALSGARAVAITGAFPEVNARIWLPFEGETLALDVAGDARERQGTVSIQGRLGRTWLAKASEILGRDVTYYATIDEPPDFSATATIDKALKWSRIDARLLSGPIVARGVALDRARILGAVTPGHVEVHHLEVSRGDEAATGTYEDTLATRDNRFILRGSMRPLSIAPWFSGWWRRFWDDYSFHDAPPQFEVDVQGNWVEGHKTHVSGRMSGEAVTIKDLPFNAINTRFFIRPNFYDLYETSLRREEGTLTGEVQLLFRPNDRNPARQSWRLESTVDIVSLASIFGPGGVKLFEPYRYDLPPSVSGQGTITQEGGVYDSDIGLSIRTDNAFRYYDFPLEALQTDVRIHNSHVELPEIRATYAGGTVTGNAVVEGGQLTVEAALADADYDLAVDTFGAFLERQSPTPPNPQEEPSGLGRRKVGGRLDIQVAAKGPLTDYQAYEGTGTTHIREGDLAKINLFGPLGDVLNSLGIKLGTLSLNEAVATFDIHHEKLVFPKVRITGRTGALETDGTYLLGEGSLNFKARLFPLRESSGLFTQVFGLMLEPLSNLLEMRLTGTLEQPQWSFTRDPISILRDLVKKKEAAEQPEAPPSESTPREPPATSQPAGEVIEAAPIEPAPDDSPTP